MHNLPVILLPAPCHVILIPIFPRTQKIPSQPVCVIPCAAITSVMLSASLTIETDASVRHWRFWGISISGKIFQSHFWTCPSCIISRKIFAQPTHRNGTIRTILISSNCSSSISSPACVSASSGAFRMLSVTTTLIGGSAITFIASLPDRFDFNRFGEQLTPHPGDNAHLRDTKYMCCHGVASKLFTVGG